MVTVMEYLLLGYTLFCVIGHNLGTLIAVNGAALKRDADHVHVVSANCEHNQFFDEPMGKCTDCANKCLTRKFCPDECEGWAKPSTTTAAVPTEESYDFTPVIGMVLLFAAITAFLAVVVVAMGKFKSTCGQFNEGDSGQHCADEPLIGDNVASCRPDSCKKQPEQYIRHVVPGCPPNSLVTMPTIGQIGPYNSVTSLRSLPPSEADDEGISVEDAACAMAPEHTSGEHSDAGHREDEVIDKYNNTEDNSTVVSIKQGDDTFSLNVNAKTPSNSQTRPHVAANESGHPLEVPGNLPIPTSSNIMEILHRIPWIEEYVCFGDQWEINVSPGVNPRLAAVILRQVTGLEYPHITVDIYEECGEGFQKQGDPSEEGEGQLRKQADIGPDEHLETNQVSQKSSEDNVTAMDIKESDNAYIAGGKHFLYIGEKMQWKQGGKTMCVTIGSFVSVTAQTGEKFACVQTSCEGAGEGTPCSVTRSGKQLTFGHVMYTFENNNYDQTSFDVMLVKINSKLFTPVPDIMVKVGNQEIRHRIRKYTGKISKLKLNTPVKKLSSQKLLGSESDGQVCLPLYANKRGHYRGLTGVTSTSVPGNRISSRGDCGTLITSLPRDGALYAYGSIYGADTRKDRNNHLEVGFTVISPIREAFEAIKKKYDLFSLEFLGEENRGWLSHPIQETREADNQGDSLYDSGLCTNFLHSSNNAS